MAIFNSYELIMTGGYPTFETRGDKLWHDGMTPHLKTQPNMSEPRLILQCPYTIPSGNDAQFAIEHGPVEIMSFPIKHCDVQ